MTVLMTNAIKTFALAICTSTWYFNRQTIVLDAKNKVHQTLWTAICLQSQ